MENKPIIGITRSFINEDYFLKDKYSMAVENCGGIPRLLNYSDDPDEVIKNVSGILFSGGGDIDPSCYNEERHPLTDNIIPARDAFEFSLCEKLLNDVDIPVFCICRGHQVLNVVAGGNLIQHIDDHSQKGERSDLTHEILIEKDSVLYDILGKTAIVTNSFHHQAAGRLGKNVLICAKTETGVIEAMSIKGKKFMFGVQWHPEDLFENNSDQKKLFEHFITLCE